MRIITRGGLLLRVWLKDERRSQQWLAEQIGTDQTSVSAWMVGLREVPLRFAVAIHKLTKKKIPVAAWTIPADSDSSAA